MSKRYSRLTQKAHATDYDGRELKDYSAAAAGLFGTYRVPAALFAGASAGAAFAMPIAGSDAPREAVVKRLYSILMVGSLTCQLQTVIISTVAIGRLARDFDDAHCLGAFLRRNFELEWLATRCNFFFGVMGFAVAVGLRAWVTVACPAVAKVALQIVVTGTLFALAFVNDGAGGDAIDDPVWRLPALYARALAKKAKRRPLFAVAATSAAYTCFLAVHSAFHVWRSLHPA